MPQWGLLHRQGRGRLLSMLLRNERLRSRSASTCVRSEPARNAAAAGGVQGLGGSGEDGGWPGGGAGAPMGEST
jgi:hypothetical protein